MLRINQDKKGEKKLVKRFQNVHLHHLERYIYT